MTDNRREVLDFPGTVRPIVCLPVGDGLCCFAPSWHVFCDTHCRVWQNRRLPSVIVNMLGYRLHNGHALLPDRSATQSDAERQHSVLFRGWKRTVLIQLRQTLEGGAGRLRSTKRLFGETRKESVLPLFASGVDAA